MQSKAIYWQQQWIKAAILNILPSLRTLENFFGRSLKMIFLLCKFCNSQVKLSFWLSIFHNPSDHSAFLEPAEKTVQSSCFNSVITLVVLAVSSIDVQDINTHFNSILQIKILIKIAWCLYKAYKNKTITIIENVMIFISKY